MTSESETGFRSSVSAPRSRRATSSRSSMRASRTRADCRICRMPAAQRLLVERLLFLEEIRPSHDRRQRRAQLVVHVLQEVVLEPARRAAARPPSASGSRTAARCAAGARTRSAKEVIASISSCPNPPGRLIATATPSVSSSVLSGANTPFSGADQLLDLAVAVRVAAEIVGAVGLAGAEDHARDRARVHRDLEPRGDVLGQVPGRQRRLEPVRVGIVEGEPDALGLGEGGDGLGRARRGPP